MRLEGQKEPHKQEMIRKYAEEVRKRRIKLGASFDKGSEVFKERVGTCDYPVRTLFEIQQAIVSLRLVYLSWEYFLYCAMAERTEDAITLIKSDYQDFKSEATKVIQNSIDPLCQARMGKMHFEQACKMGIDQWPTFVKYEYRDTFSSSFPNDPFKGGDINHHEEVELGWYDVSF